MMKSLLIVFALAACGPETEQVIVAPYRQPCVGEGSFLCMQLMNVETGESRPTAEGIEGYTPEWGKTSRVVIRIEEVDDPPIDGSSINLFLEGTLEESRIDEGEFELTFDAPPGNAWFSGTTSPLNMAGTNVECESAVCDAIIAATEQSIAFTVTMQLTSDGNTLIASAFE